MTEERKIIFKYGDKNGNNYPKMSRMEPSSCKCLNEKGSSSEVMNVFTVKILNFTLCKVEDWKQKKKFWLIFSSKGEK